MRKHQENNSLIADVFRCGIDIKKANLLTLDDFSRGAKKLDQLVTNTMKAWMDHGGRPYRVWVCNPDPTISNAVSLARGRGYTGYLLDFVRDIIGRNDCPQFDVVYLDFCGFFESHQQDIETIFRNHSRLFAGTTLIHITTSRREGVGIDYILNWITYWCQIYECGKLKVLESPYSSTMVKISIVVKRCEDEYPRTKYEGRRVGKYFDNEFFRGTVCSVWKDSHGNRFAHIVYEDGDEEDVDFSDLDSMLC